jgi:hypothetical protein
MAPDSRKKKAQEGLLKLLGRDATATQQELDEAHAVLEVQKAKQAATLGELGEDEDPQVGEKASMSEEAIQALGRDDDGSSKGKSKSKGAAKAKKR